MVRLLPDAFESTRQNRGSVLAYMLWTSLLALALDWANLFPANEIATQPWPRWAPWYNIGFILVHAAAYALVTAVCFARMGANIDRPLWKCKNDAEALRRFFMPWFILNLFSLTLLDAQNSLSQGENGGIQLLIFFLLFVTTLPVGACVMYGGGLDWNILIELLRPFWRLFPLTLQAMLLLALEFFLLLSGLVFHHNHPSLEGAWWFYPALNLPLAYMDCLAFALMWRVCMIHRDLPPPDTSDDYDF
jgi:hypothetical protein